MVLGVYCLLTSLPHHLPPSLCRVLVVLGVYCILGTILTSQKPNASDRCYNNVPHKQASGRQEESRGGEEAH